MIYSNKNHEVIHLDNSKWILFSFLSLFSLVLNYMINKGLSINYTPFLSMAVTGISQFILAGVFFLFSKESFAYFSTYNFILCILVAVCVLGIDYGMITAYKMGGNSVIITLIVSMATVVMVPISYFLFKERLSIPQVMGVILSIVSISLVVLFPAK